MPAENGTEAEPDVARRQAGAEGEESKAAWLCGIPRTAGVGAAADELGDGGGAVGIAAAGVVAADVAAVGILVARDIIALGVIGAEEFVRAAWVLLGMD